MVRVEIVLNRSVEGDLFDRLQSREIASSYTLLPVAHGVGSSGPRHGDHIWPEENIVVIVYCEREEADAIREAVEELKGIFPDEGIRMFEISST